MATMPVLFVSHGAPTLALEDNATARHWRSLPDLLPAAPKAVLCISAHWDAPGPRVGGGVERPAIRHDFSGFPPELYEITWDVAGSPEWASRIADCLGEVDPPRRSEPGRPLDHGVWVPLRVAWPRPPMPVLQLSVSTPRGGRWHLELGRRLAPLRQEGVLIVASGGITHNLARLERDPDAPVAPWAEGFVKAFETALAVGDEHALSDPWRLAHGRDCHPTVEHYLPVLVALGAGRTLFPLHRDWMLGSLGLHTYAAGHLEVAAREAA